MRNLGDEGAEDVIVRFEAPTPGPLRIARRAFRIERLRPGQEEIVSAEVSGSADRKLHLLVTARDRRGHSAKALVAVQPAP